MQAFALTPWGDERHTEKGREEEEEQEQEEEEEQPEIRRPRFSEKEISLFVSAPLHI